MTKIPANYRRVKASDQPRTGDLYINRNTGIVDEMTVNSMETAGFYKDYTFWRKRKKPATVKFVADKGLPLVGFTYTNKGQVTYRTVKVTKATLEYIEGFETPTDQFKRFLRIKAEGIHLLRFNAE